MKRWWIAVAGLLVIGLAVAAFAILGPGFAAKAQVQYLSSNAAIANVVARVVANGTVQPARTDSFAFGSTPSSESAAASGAGSNANKAATGGTSSSLTWSVSAVDVVVGDHVTAGRALASASTTGIDAKIAVAAAQVTAAKTQLDRGGSTLTVANAGEALLAAMTNLADLETARAFAGLTASEAGTITAVNVAKGANAPSGAAIVMVSDEMIASGTVTESDVPSITVGQKATITLSAFGTDVTGKVSYVAQAGSSTSGVVGFAIQVALDSVPANTRPGMSATITVVTNEVDGVLAVPSVALSGSIGSYTVTVLAADGTTSVQQVGVGLVTSDLAQVTTGLTTGQAVVTGTASTQLTTTGTGGGFRGGGFGGFGGGFGGGAN